MANDDQMRTYTRSESVVLLKVNEDFGGLTNMSAYKLRVPVQNSNAGVTVLTTEALYQACRYGRGLGMRTRELPGRRCEQFLVQGSLPTIQNRDDTVAPSSSNAGSRSARGSFRAASNRALGIFGG